MTKPVDTKIPSIVCTECGAKAGELCSDNGVFVREDAFQLEQPRPLPRTTSTPAAP